MNGNGSFGNWLKQRRKALDLTQVDLAGQVGCSVITIQTLEADKRRPSKQIAERLADALAIAPEERAAFVTFARRSQAIPPSLPLTTGATAFHNLPAQPTAFIGRTDELIQISQRLNNPVCRLVTLVGQGGIGKTRLALQAASERVTGFAHGVYFIPLAPVNSPDLVASAMAGALKVSFYSSDSPNVQIINYLREKHMLLVLDNFEHLLAGTGLLIDILEAAPAVKLLVTSRERLNVQEEWVLALDGLAFPQAQTSDSIEGYSAVQLFVERAQQGQAKFSLNDNAESVITICQRAEGMPLGLELAAPWLRVMPCYQIAAQLERSLDFLITPLRNVPERHRSLRAVFEHSWRLLSDIERQVLAALSVFRGGFDQESAEYVAGASLPILAGLVDKSLIRLSPSGRFDLHELLRQFAADKLAESGETAAATERHLEYFSKLADEAEAHLYGPLQEAWFDRLELEHDNLSAALAWALMDKKAEAGLHLAGALGFFWEFRTHQHEGIEWLEKILAIADDASATARAKALRFAGAFVSGIDDNERARLYLEESLRLARATGNKFAIAWALGSLGYFVVPKDVLLLEDALALFREIGDGFGTNHMLRRLAIILTNVENDERARILAEEAVTLARGAKDNNATAWALYILGRAIWVQNHDPKQTRTLIEESLSLAREVQDRYMIVCTLYYLGEAAQAQGDYERAQNCYAESLAIFQEMVISNLLAVSNLVGLGELAGAQQQPTRAARLLGAATAIAAGRDGPHPIARVNEVEHDVSALRAQLGEEAFASAWTEGGAMTMKQAIAYALNHDN